MIDVSFEGIFVMLGIWVISFVSRPLIPLIILLISAGTWSWSNAWMYLGFSVVLGLTSRIFFSRRNMQLEPQEFIVAEFMELSFADKALYICCQGLEYLTFTIVGIDVYRYAWSPPSYTGRILGGVLMLTMYGIALKAIHQYRQDRKALPRSSMYKSSLARDVLYRYPRSLGVVSLLTSIGYVLMLGSRWGLLVGGAWGLINYIFIHRRAQTFSPKRYAFRELHLLYHLSPLRRILWFPYKAT